MIQADNIHKYYNDLHVLKGVSLKIDKGEIVSIVGASGAGKTTLLQILGTLDKPAFEEGTSLAINGEDIIGMKDRALSQFRNQRLGFIFQFHQLLPEFTALENVCIPAFIANKSKAEAEKEGKRLLDYLGLSHRINHKPGELSGGEQQRVAVARALANRPRLVLADEPTGNLDPSHSEEALQLMRRLCEESGASLLLVCHDPRVISQFDRVINFTELNCAQGGVA